MRRLPCLFRALCAALFACGVLTDTACGQMLRFDSYRDFVVPDNANIRLGSFYSDWSMAQSAGVRYMRSSGEGSDYLFQNGRGQIKDDGLEFPLVTSLSLQNYLMISKYMDLDLSFNVTYSYFPNRTEDNQFDFNMISQGLSARMGAFTITAARDSVDGTFNGNNASAGAYTHGAGAEKGFSANLSTEFDLTPYVKGRVYDSPAYTVSYVDERGRADQLRGNEYRYIQNTVGLDLDWLMAKDKDLSPAVVHTDTWPLDKTFNQTRSSVTTPSLTYQQQLSPVLLVGTRADWTWREFDANIRGNQFQEDYTVFMGADLTENTVLRAGGGYSLATLTNAGAAEQNGDTGAVVGNVSLQSMLTERTTHSIGYTRRMDGGFGAGLEVTDEYRYAIAWHNDEWSWSFLTAYSHVQPRLALVSDYTDWLNQLGVTRTLTQHLTAMLNAAYTIRQNGPVQQNDLNGNSIFVANDYSTWAVNLGLSQQLTDHLSVYYYVEHLMESGDTSTLDFERDTVGATITYQHDF